MPLIIYPSHTRAVTLRGRDLLHGRRSLDTDVFPRLLPTHLPERYLPENIIWPHGSVSLLRHFQRLHHDLPMHTGALLLVWLDRRVRRKLHQHQRIFLVQGRDADRDGLGHHQSPNQASGRLVPRQQEEDPDHSHVLHGVSVSSSQLQHSYCPCY